MSIRHLASAGVLAVAVAWAPTPTAAQPAVSASVPFTLADALARARDESPEAAAMRARVDAARLAAGHAGWLPNPVVEFRTENLASGVSRSILPLDTFAEVTQVIELGGKRAARRAVAEAEAGGVAAAAAVLDARVALEVSRGYLDAVRLRERHRALAAHVADLIEAARVLERRVAVGATAGSELLRVQTEAARAGSDLVRTELAASRALVALTSRLAVETTLNALVAPPAPGLPTADEAAVSRRPDMAAASRTVDTARQGLRLEDARAVPDPAVNAGYKRTVGYNTAQVTVSVPIPLFNRNRPARILAEGQVRAAELERTATERRARGELAATRAAAVALTLRAQDARATLVEPAIGARDAARAAFSTGVLDVLRLVDAERTFTEATLVAIDLEVDAVVAAIEARLAAGEDPLP